MNREKEIKGMAKVLFGHYCGNDECGKCKEPNCIDYRKAERLFNAGYRLCGGENCPNFKHYQDECDYCTKKMEVKKSFEIESAVQQAVKEFAEKLKKELWKFDGSWQEYDGEELCETVNNLITELYGADE